MTSDAAVYVVDDDADLGSSVARLLNRQGYRASAFTGTHDLLGAHRQDPASCVISDIMMGETTGFAFADALRAFDPDVALIFMTAWPTTANAVDSIRRYGGLDYLEKPIDECRLLSAISEGVVWSTARRALARRTVALTAREREVFDLLVRGYSNKAIASELDLSAKTVESHRAAIVAKTGANGLAQLMKLAS
jgi:two-component system response regulator DctR/two-component system response regulator FixJ